MVQEVAGVNNPSVFGGAFWPYLVEILVFSSATGYML